MNRSLQKLLLNPSPAATEIDEFVAQSEFPLIDGRNITFVFRGKADAVNLRCWISGLDTAQPLQRLEETDLWAVSIDLPEGSRIEYKFEVVNDGEHSLILDPLNPVKAHDPFGANSVCQGYGYRRPAWTLHDPHVRAGDLVTLSVASRVFAENREVQVYLPPRFRRNRRYPLLLVHDGLDYLRYADFKTVLDNLIFDLEIPPMIVAMMQSPDRLVEYAGDDRHADFVATELLPELQASFPLQDEPEARCVMGASFGGVAALHAAWKHPRLYGSLLLQSGSFAFSDFGRHQRGPVFDPVVKFINAFRENPGQPVQKIYMSCGIYESLIYENRSLLPRLQEQGIEVSFEEARDAHNWENWRDRLRNGLSALFPGPVWMVYE